MTLDRNALTIGLAVRDDQIHGVWMRGLDRVHSDAVPLGIRPMSEALTELMGKSKESPENVVIGVPFQRVFIRSIEIPPAPDLPLAMFAEQFAATELPYPIEEAVFDYSVLEKENDRRLLLAAGQKKDFEPYRALLQPLRVPHRAAIPLTLACFKAAGVPKDEPNFLFIYFWSTYIDLLWCAYGRPRHLRHVPMQRSRILTGVTSKDPDVLGALASEIRISGELIRKQSGMELRSVMACVVSCDRRFEEVPALLQPDVPFTIQGKLLDGPEGAMLAAGACRVLSDPPPDMNFFAPKKSNPADAALPPNKRQRILVAALAGILLIVVMAIVKTVVSYTWVKDAEAARTARAVSPENPLPDGAAEQMAAFVTAPDAVDALDLLSKSIPPSTDLQDVSIEAGQISIRGAAPRAMAVYEGLTSGGFPDVRFSQEVVADPESGLEMFAILAQNPYAPAAESR